MARMARLERKGRASSIGYALAPTSRKNTCTFGHIVGVGNPQGAGERDGGLKSPCLKVGDAVSQRH